MRVTFTKHVERRVVTWQAVRGKRTRVPGSTMALGRGELPHDLAQLVVEGVLGVEHGFWACMAAGATFRSTHRRATKPGRAVIAARRGALGASGRLVDEHVDRWRAGRPTPAGVALDEFALRWEAVEPEGTLVVDWPTLHVHAVTTASP